MHSFFLVRVIYFIVLKRGQSILCKRQNLVLTKFIEIRLFINSLCQSLADLSTENSSRFKIKEGQDSVSDISSIFLQFDFYAHISVFWTQKWLCDNQKGDI